MASREYLTRPRAPHRVVICAERITCVPTSEVAPPGATVIAIEDPAPVVFMYKPMPLATASEPPGPPRLLRVGDLVFDLWERTVRNGTAVANLAPAEWKLFDLASKDHGRLVTFRAYNTWSIEQGHSVRSLRDPQPLTQTVQRLHNRMVHALDAAEVVFSSVRGKGFRRLAAHGGEEGVGGRR